MLCPWHWQHLDLVALDLICFYAHGADDLLQLQDMPEIEGGEAGGKELQGEDLQIRQLTDYMQAAIQMASVMAEAQDSQAQASQTFLLDFVDGCLSLLLLQHHHVSHSQTSFLINYL